MKRKFALALACLLLLSLNGISSGQEKFFEKRRVRTIKGPKWVPGEIIVKFKQGVSQDAIRRINRRHGASTLSISKTGQFLRIRIRRNTTAKEMVAVYTREPDVEYAEPNFILRAFTVPNDPLYSYQWHMDNLDYGGINMESAWDHETGSPDVIVAVVDTGVAYADNGRFKRAPDLANTSFVSGYDFVNNDAEPNDDESHGTHVTGTIAQSTNNNLGVAGVAFNVSIMPIKVLDRNGSGTDADIADGIYFAANNGADIINLSLGGEDSSTTLENAVAYAYNNGVTIVCAAGNEFQQGNPTSYPAAYNAYCIAVGATRYDEARAPYSNTGSYIDLTAPGGDLDVDQNDDGYNDGVLQQTFSPITKRPNDFGYWFFDGTSMASPHVAGVAALVIANGVTGPDNVRAALQATAEDKGPIGWDEQYGWGIVDACAALGFCPPKAYDVSVAGISAPSSALRGDVVSVTVNVANQGDYDESFAVALTDTTDAVEIDSQLVSLPAKGTTDLIFFWDTIGASDGAHVLSADASAVPGETNTADNARTTTVTISEPVHDVAVIAVDVPFESNQGDLVPVSVTVENQGTFSETTNVTLTDTTDSVFISSQPVSLDAGGSTVLSFDWDTTAASIGDHILRAEADTVPEETDTADNFLTATATIIETGLATEITNVTYSAGSVTLTFDSVAGEKYNIYYKDDIDGTWLFIEQVTGQDLETQYTDDGSLTIPVPAAATSRFYRVGT